MPPRSNTPAIATNSSQEPWTKYSTSKSRYTPVHTLAQTSYEYIRNAILKIHALTECEAISKVGTTAAALKVNYYLLASFGQNRRPSTLALKQTEKYLYSVLYPKENCNEFDDLRFIPYTKKNKTVIPPASNMSHLILSQETNLNPVEFGWNSVDSVLMTNKYNRYCTRDVHCYLWLQEKMHWKMSVQQVCHFMLKILQVHRRRILYLSLPIDSVGHSIRYGYGNIKVFSEPNFAVYRQNPRTYRENTYQRKTVYWHILPSVT